MGSSPSLYLQPTGGTSLVGRSVCGERMPHFPSSRLISSSVGKFDGLLFRYVFGTQLNHCRPVFESSGGEEETNGGRTPAIGHKLDVASFPSSSTPSIECFPTRTLLLSMSVFLACSLQSSSFTSSY